MEPGPLILPPKQPRILTSAPEVIQWVIVQDLMGDLHYDPVSVPQEVVPWIANTLHRRRNRGLN